MSNKHGNSWIVRAKRLAIYLRDNMQCLWCGACMEDGAVLSLDHYLPRSRGGGNEETNLFTGCVSCNSRRGDKSAKQFALELTRQPDLFRATPFAREILARISIARRRTLRRHLRAAKAMIEARGGYSQALRHEHQSSRPHPRQHQNPQKSGGVA